MKKVIITFKDDSVYQEAYEEMFSTLLRDIEDNIENVRDSVDYEEDENEIRLHIKELSD